MFPKSSAELIKNTSTVSPTTLPTVKDALDNLQTRTPTSLPVPISEGGTGQTSKTPAFDALSPLSALGDLLSYDGSDNIRVAVGAADTFLGSTGAAVPSWRTVAQVLTSLGFEVGTFTPSASFATPGTSSWAYGTQSGLYVKSPRLIWISINLAATPTIGTGSGNFRLEGLPVAPDVSGVGINVHELNANWTWPAGRTQIVAFTTSGQTYLQLRGQGSALGAISFASTNMTNGASHTVRVDGEYRIAT